jgi:hypothetical protein
MKTFLKPIHQKLLSIVVLCLILFGGMYFLWRMYKTYKYSSQNWNTYLSQNGKYSFKYPDTKMYFEEYGGLELHAYRLPAHEKVPYNIQIQYAPQSMAQTNAATVLKNCNINKKRELKTTDATFEIYENAKCDNSFDTEVDIHANNGMVYLISIPDAVDPDFLNSFLLTFTFYSQASPQNLPYISPTPKYNNRLVKLPDPITDLDSPWKVYESEKYGFSLSYPSNWKKKEILSSEDTYNMIRIAKLEGSEGDFDIYLYTPNYHLLPELIACNPFVSDNGKSQSQRSIQLSDQQITLCETNNGLRWKWDYFKTFPTGTLRITGGTNILHGLEQGSDNPYSDHDKDVILRIFSTLKLNR